MSSSGWFETLRVRLAHFQTEEDLLKLADQLMQKEPDRKKSLESVLDSCQSFSRGQRVKTGQKWFRDTILSIVRNPEQSKLPSRIEAYTSYLDLLITQKQSRIGKKKWQVYKMVEYRADESNLIQIRTFRRRIKEFLDVDDYISSVQISIDDEDENASKIFFRIVAVRKARKDQINEQRLLKKAPVFVVFYPGEPYFYVDRSDPGDRLLTALCSGFCASHALEIDLRGSNPDDLRVMRLVHDEKVPRMHIEARAKARNALHDLDKYFISSNAHPEETINLPKLENVMVNFTGPFKGEKSVQSFVKDSKGLSVPKLDFKITLDGEHVLEGLQTLSSHAKRAVPDRELPQNFVAAPLPNWLKNLPSSGRNTIRLSHDDEEGRSDCCMNIRRED